MCKKNLPFIDFRSRQIVISKLLSHLQVHNYVCILLTCTKKDKYTFHVVFIADIHTQSENLLSRSK